MPGSGIASPYFHIFRGLLPVHRDAANVPDRVVDRFRHKLHPAQILVVMPCVAGNFIIPGADRCKLLSVEASRLNLSSYNGLFEIPRRKLHMDLTVGNWVVDVPAQPCVKAGDIVEYREASVVKNDSLGAHLDLCTSKTCIRCVRWGNRTRRHVSAAICGASLGLLDTRVVGRTIPDVVLEPKNLIVEPPQELTRRVRVLGVTLREMHDCASDLVAECGIACKPHDLTESCGSGNATKVANREAHCPRDQE